MNYKQNHLVFFIKNHYLIPIEKCYKISLPNPISIYKNRLFSIDIKLPKQIFAENFVYESYDFPKKYTTFM